MIRVAYIVYDKWDKKQSGLSTYIGAICGLFSRDGFDPEIVEIPGESASAGGEKALERPHRRDRGDEKPSVRFACRLALGYVTMLWRDFRFLWQARKRLLGRIVITNEFGCEVLPIALRSVLPFSRIIAISHTHAGMKAGAQHPVRRIVEKLCHACVSDVIYNSYALKDEWRKKLHLKRSRGTVIWHGIDEPDLTLPADLPRREGETIDFICVARFVYWKGHKNLLKAWKAARDTTAKKIRLILVGDGAAFDETREFARRLGLGGDVIFLGARERGARYFTGGDVGVLLPIEPEAFGLVLLEAMSRGKAVIASRIGGIQEVVEDGQSGILVDPFNSEEVAGAIRRLAESPQERLRMGRYGYARWRRHFTVDRMLDDYEAYFRRMVNDEEVKCGR